MARVEPEARQGEGEADEPRERGSCVCDRVVFTASLNRGHTIEHGAMGIDGRGNRGADGAQVLVGPQVADLAGAGQADVHQGNGDLDRQ